MDPVTHLSVVIPVDRARIRLGGLLESPHHARGIVIFAHGSGSSRFSPRNRYVAAALQAEGFATLLFDLLTEDEAGDRANVFNIPLLAARVVDAVHWVRGLPEAKSLPVGLFGASTGAAAALVAAAECRDHVAAVVSRGGRPDLAGDSLHRVQAPTLLVVGGEDHEVIDLNEAAIAKLSCVAEVRIVPDATHLFEEPGALEEVATHAAEWFGRHMIRSGAA